MGADKGVHIQRITELDEVRRRWQEAPSRPKRALRHVAAFSLTGVPTASFVVN